MVQVVEMTEIPQKPTPRIQYELGREKPGCIQLSVFAFVAFLISLMFLL